MMGRVIKYNLFCAWFAILLTAPLQAAAPDNEPGSVDVYMSGAGGYHTYRIPAIVMTKNGVLLAFCEGRVNNSSDWGDIDIVLKRSIDRGATWGGLQVLVDDGERTMNGPTPVVDRDTGRVWLMFTKDKRLVFVTWSDDDGKTWSEPREITEDVRKDDWTWYALGPVHGIQLKSGRLVFPCDHMEPDKAGPRWLMTKVERGTRTRGVMRSHVVYSDDHGRTWKLGGSLAAHTNEATVLERSDGSVYINMRNTITNPYGKFLNWRRAVATSHDGGETWGETGFAPELTTPVCQGCVLRYTDEVSHDKNRILYSGPAATQRIRMTIWISYDEGETWPVKKLITPLPSAYSDMVVLPDMSIGLFFETGKINANTTLAFNRLSLEWLSDGADSIPK